MSAAGRGLLACLKRIGQPEAVARARLRALARHPGRTRLIKQFLAAVERIPDAALRAALLEALLQQRVAATAVNPLPGPLVVSLTSYPRRFPVLHFTLRSLLAQSLRADSTVLWIAHEDAATLPESVLALQAQGLQIRFCDDLRSYNKILPMRATQPEAFIVTADDDVCYPPDWLERIARQAARNPDCVIAWRARLIGLDRTGLPQPYVQWRMARRWDWLRWRWRNGLPASAAPELVFPTGVGGVLYPPGALQADSQHLQRITALAPHADDLGLYWIWRGNGYLASLVDGERFSVALWPGSQVQTLMAVNVATGGNDAQLRQLTGALGTRALQAGTGRRCPALIEARTRDGFRMLVDPTDRIGSHIAHRGLYDAGNIDAINRVLPLLQPRTLLDIGANIGNHALAWSGQCQRIIAFEPGKRAFALLKHNIAANTVPHIRALNLGLSDAPSSATLYVNTAGNLGASSLHNRHAGAEEERIALQAGDACLAALGVDDVDFIKIDVEGHERQALTGLRDTLARCRPLVLTEWSAQSSDRDWIRDRSLREALFPDYVIHALIRETDRSYWKGRPHGWLQRCLRKLRPGKRRVLIVLDPADRPPDTAKDLLLVPREKLHCLARIERLPYGETEALQCTGKDSRPASTDLQHGLR